LQTLELSLADPLANIALDEALLAAAEAGEITGGVLRLWESPQLMVVLGRSSDPTVEVYLAACQQQQVPVLRRASGGGTVVNGPGCLSYAVVLSYEEFPHLRAIPVAHRFVLERVATSLELLVPGIALAGTSDLAIPSHNRPAKKFSGNAMRCQRSHFLYHGTLLYDFDLGLLDHLLATHTRAPLYRAGRSHSEFVTNLPVGRDELIAALRVGWGANEDLADWPKERMNTIVEEKRKLHPRWIVL